MATAPAMSADLAAAPRWDLASAVLYVIDVQNGFITPESEHVAPVIAKIVDCWSAAGGAIAFSRYFNYTDSEFERLSDFYGLYGPPETDLDPRISTAASDPLVIDKLTYSGLSPEFERVARRHRWTDVVLCGIDTELCVLATALEAFDRGFTPWIVADGCASTGGDAAHAAGMRVLTRGIGERQIIDTGTLLGQL